VKKEPEPIIEVKKVPEPIIEIKKEPEPEIIMMPPIEVVNIEKDMEGEYPRLIRITGGVKQINSYWVPCNISSINNSDVFILDDKYKNTIYQYNGGGSVFLKNKAASIIKSIVDERNIKIEKEVIDEGHEAPLFWEILGGKPTSLPESSPEPTEPPKLFKLYEDNGQLIFEFVCSGKAITKSSLSTDNIMVLDTGFNIFLWEGRGANKLERESAFRAARKYCSEFNRPKQIEVMRGMEGGENEVFELYVPNNLL